MVNWGRSKTYLRNPQKMIVIRERNNNLIICQPEKTYGCHIFHSVIVVIECRFFGIVKTYEVISSGWVVVLFMLLL